MAKVSSVVVTEVKKAVLVAKGDLAVVGEEEVVECSLPEW